MNCRHCNNKLEHVFLDLGFAPPSNAYLTEDDLNKPELTYPLKLYVCSECWLVQTEDYAQADELFSSDYAYFSSVSSGWLAHAKTYVDMITELLELNSDSFVVEIAANDGYLLKNFVAADIPCLGIEPTDSTALAAEELGIPILRDFFSKTLAKQLADEKKQADLIIGNNVFAHVPDINDFTAGLKRLLKPGGTITLEFPHLLRLIQERQFDTVYHEHFSYLSLYTVIRIFKETGLRIFDVEKLVTHGGSLRIYACHAEDQRETKPIVANLIEEEQESGMRDLPLYIEFQDKINKIKNDLLIFLIEQKRKGKKVVAYGAAAKGNTILNYAGIKHDLIQYVYDAAPSKQGKYLPGNHISILVPNKLKHYEPDYIVILPWNLKKELISQLEDVREWGGQFVVAVPELKIL